MAHQVVAALDVVDLAVGPHLVGIAGAVLGDVHRARMVVVLDAQQEFGQALRRHFPAHVSGFHARCGRQHARRQGAVAGSMLDGLGEVVVHAEEVGRHRDGLEVARQHDGGGVADRLQYRLWITVAVQRIEEPAVAQAVVALGGGDVLKLAGSGTYRMQAQGETGLGMADVGADQRHRLAVREQHVVRHLQRGLEIGVARRMPAFVVADDGRAPGFVVGDPVLHAVAQAARHRVDKGEVGVDGGALVPAAAVLQVLRQVPVVEGGPGLQAAFQHAVHQARIEIQALFVGLAAHLGEDARPGDREAVGVQSHVAADVEVFRPAVVVVAGDKPVGTVLDSTWRGGETVPDRFDPAVFLAGAFDLVRRGGAAPQEVGGEIAARWGARLGTGCFCHGLVWLSLLR